MARRGQGDHGRRMTLEQRYEMDRRLAVGETYDEVADRRYLSEGSMAKPFPPPTEEIDTTDPRDLPAA